MRPEDIPNIMFKSIFNLFWGIRLFIGILFLAFGCLCDMDGHGIITGLRFLSGLLGAFMIVGNSNEGIGYIVFLVLGISIYSFAIRSGSLEIMTLRIPDLVDCPITLEGSFKYSLRLLSAFMFILGVVDVKNH